MPKTPSKEDWDAKRFEASQLFSPSAPINEHDLFAGRLAEIRKMIEAMTERGKHIILFGERGVGKTSLANVFSGLFPETLRHISLVREQVDPSDDFSSVWKKVFRDLHVKEVKEGREVLIPLSEFFPKEIYPDDVRREFDQIFKPNDLPIVVIDEFDKSPDKSIHEIMANTIKALSDYSVNVTVLIVGVADDIHELIGEHPSISRCLEQVPMSRMDNREMREIIDKRVSQLGMEVHPDAYFKIIELSRGLPAYAHLLGLYSVQSAIERHSLTVSESDVDTAIQRALERSQESIQGDYTSAIHSNRSDSLYRHVLLACALAKTDSRGQFTPQSICNPLSDILGRPIRVDTFQQHLKKFITDERAHILSRKGRERAYKFRFRDPMMQPYIIMRGIDEELIPPVAIKSLSFPAEAQFDFSSAP